jgi:uncharacterized sulfatase
VTTNAPLRDEKGTLYEGGIREPLIVRWPGRVAKGTTCGAPVTSTDFFPTLAAAARAPLPPEQVLDGVNLAPVLEGRNRLDRDALYWHYPHYHHSTPAGAIRRGKWKLIEFFEDGRLELYNLERDIGETQNLASDQPRRAARLRSMLREWREDVGAKMPVPNPDYDPDRAEEWGVHPSARR